MIKNYDVHQKPCTKSKICCSELLVAVESRNSLLVIPWTVCNGLERLRHGFRRVSSHETTKTSVEVRYANSEVRMSQLRGTFVQNSDNLLGRPKIKVSEENLHLLQTVRLLDHFPGRVRPRRGCRSVLRCAKSCLTWRNCCYFRFLIRSVCHYRTTW